MAQFAWNKSRPRCSWAVSGRDFAEELELHATSESRVNDVAKSTNGRRTDWKRLLNHLLSASRVSLQSAHRSY